jgi:molybdopterin-guanine dinucleotide biosynthesis protein A
MTVVGVLLAGGRSQRMGGGDKSLITLAGKPLIVRAAERLAPQVDRLVINANGDPARFAAVGLPVVADADGGYTGPLAGILVGIDWARANVPSAQWIATVAADTPFVPRDLVTRFLSASTDETTIRLAASNGRLHQVIGLWPIGIREGLSQWLKAGGSRAVRDWLATSPHVVVDFEAPGGVDPFFNINTPEDLAAAHAMAAERAHEKQATRRASPATGRDR